MFFPTNTPLSNPMRLKIVLLMPMKNTHMDQLYASSVLHILQRNFTLAAAIAELSCEWITLSCSGTCRLHDHRILPIQEVCDYLSISSENKAFLTNICLNYASQGVSITKTELSIIVHDDYISNRSLVILFKNWIQGGIWSMGSAIGAGSDLIFLPGRLLCCFEVPTQMWWVQLLERIAMELLRKSSSWREVFSLIGGVQIIEEIFQ